MAELTEMETEDLWNDFWGALHALPYAELYEALPLNEWTLAKLQGMASAHFDKENA